VIITLPVAATCTAPEFPRSPAMLPKAAVELLSDPSTLISPAATATAPPLPPETDPSDPSTPPPETLMVPPAGRTPLGSFPASGIAPSRGPATLTIVAAPPSAARRPPNTVTSPPTTSNSFPVGGDRLGWNVVTAVVELLFTVGNCPFTVIAAGFCGPR